MSGAKGLNYRAQKFTVQPSHWTWHGIVALNFPYHCALHRDAIPLCLGECEHPGLGV